MLAAADESLEVLGGRVDVLVNNAAWVQGGAQRAEDESHATIRRTLSINVEAPILLAQQFVPGMKEVGAGSIINISSLVACSSVSVACPKRRMRPRRAHWSRSPAKWAAQWSGEGVRVNSIAPGWIETEITAGAIHQANVQRWILRNTLIPRHGQPEDLDGTLLLLAYNAGRYITGACIVARRRLDRVNDRAADKRRTPQHGRRAALQAVAHHPKDRICSCHLARLPTAPTTYPSPSAALDGLHACGDGRTLVEPTAEAETAPRHRAVEFVGERSTAAKSSLPGSNATMEPTPATPPRHPGDATDPDHDDPATRSRVTRVDASTHVNEHDQNVDTLLTPAKRVRGPTSGSYPRPSLGTIDTRPCGLEACKTTDSTLDTTPLLQGSRARKRALGGSHRESSGSHLSETHAGPFRRGHHVDGSHRTRAFRTDLRPAGPAGLRT